MILRARHLLPIVSPPIANGAVWIEGGRIVEAGAWPDIARQASGPAVDLGDTVLLPGLINAHCHLDYTGMAGQLPPPREFSEWIKGIIAIKASWSYSDYAASWVAGAKMSVDHGTTTVLDIEAVPELLPDVWDSTPMRVISCLEMLQIKREPGPRQVVQAAERKIRALEHPARAAGLSPHAPYSTTAALLEAAAHVARRLGCLTTMHIAESASEFEMYLHRRGPLFEWLKNQRDMADCGGRSPVQYVDSTGLLNEAMLAVHLNYLLPDDPARLAKRQASVVHCPRSHQYFRHEAFPRAALEKAGVNISLGTDSLASVRIEGGKKRPQLDLFAEMQTLLAYDHAVRPAEVLRMATVNAAHALRRGGQLGQISKGAVADLIAVPVAEGAGDLYELVAQHRGPVAAGMMAGHWAIPPKV